MFQPAAPALPAYAGVPRPELAVAGRCDGEPIGPSRIETPGDRRPAGHEEPLMRTAPPIWSTWPGSVRTGIAGGCGGAVWACARSGAPAHLGAPAL